MWNAKIGMPARYTLDTDEGRLTLPGQVVLVRQGNNADLVVHRIMDGGAVHSYLVEDVPYSANEASGTWCGVAS